jgi:hypothetical protein
VTGLIARNAGYIFPGRLFRNHSAENPEGTLSKFSEQSTGEDVTGVARNEPRHGSIVEIRVCMDSLVLRATPVTSSPVDCSEITLLKIQREH